MLALGSAAKKVGFFARGYSTKKVIRVVNPATEEVIREVVPDTPQDLSLKLKKAADAQKQWKKTPLSQRADCIRNFNKLLEENLDSLASTLTSEMGKPIKQAKGEIRATTNRTNFFLEHFEDVLKPQVVFQGQGMTEVIKQEPLGVVGAISAWNYPYFVSINVLAPALLTGNAILFKPSEHALLTGLNIVNLLHRSGVPDDVVQAVVGDGKIAAELVANAAKPPHSNPIQGMFFTGSNATGQKIAQALAGTLIRLQLELGGKDPTYVAEDVNVHAAVGSLADGAMYNTGQSCCSVERIYVHEQIYDQFVAAFVKEVKTFKLGNPADESTYIGPLARAPQVQFLENQVKDAVSKGAKLETGGSKTSVNGKGYFFEPTVLSNVNHTMDVMTEESFGPIIGIQKVKDDHAALQLMNDNAYGLTAGVYTTNKARAEAILENVESGSAYWNCCDRVSPRLPWLGRKNSGIGLTLSKDGIKAFVVPKGYHLKDNI